MQCIDIIEGIVKSIIIQIHHTYCENMTDDTEYTRNIKAVLEGTKEFARQNKETIADPVLLQNVLYQFSKDLWISHLRKEMASEDQDSDVEDENEDYYDYYFDYIYANKVYPF